MNGDALVRDYLTGLDTAANGLPPDRRRELVGEVRRHIDDALSEAGTRDEATVRSVLDRLGPPSEIVAAELGAENRPGDAETPAIEPVRRWRSPEVVGILLVTIGAVALPFIGPIVGIFFLWPSKAMSRWQKLGAFAAGQVLLFVVVLGLYSAARVG